MVPYCTTQYMDGKTENSPERVHETDQTCVEQHDGEIHGIASIVCSNGGSW